MFFDIHSHVYRYPYPIGDGTYLFMTPEELLKSQKLYGIDRAVLLPVVSPELYVPQSVGEVIDIAAESGGKWVPFCNVDPHVLTNSSDAPVGMLLEHYKNLGCVGIGEFMPNMQWKEKRVQNVLYHAEKSGLPLLFDMTGRVDSDYGISDEPGMPQLEKCLAAFPDLIFIGHGPAFWAEISTLRSVNDIFTYPSYPVDHEGRVAVLMRTYPNLWVDLSARSGANAMKRDVNYSIHFLNEFSDRILFGSDICYYGQNFIMTELLVGLLADGLLSQEAFDKIAFKNAEKLLYSKGWRLT